MGRVSPTSDSSGSISDEGERELQLLKNSARLQGGLAASGQQTSGSSSENSITRTKQPARTLLDRLCLFTWRLSLVALILLAINLLVYLVPLPARYAIEPKVAPHKPRPKFQGALGINRLLDERAERLWEEQFHAPESFAWASDKRSFYTGVEGGFILLVEPYAERFTVAARLNARHSVEDHSAGVRFRVLDEGGREQLIGLDGDGGPKTTRRPDEGAGSGHLFAPFCETDVELYGRRAEFEPARVRLSRCSRPLGLRLAPDHSRLYAIDPLSGLYKITLGQASGSNATTAFSGGGRHPWNQQNRVEKLLDFTELQRGSRSDERPSRVGDVYFGDDIAVEFSSASSGAEDVIYFTDCSRRWPLRYLFMMIAENDDSGRVLRFQVGQKLLSQLSSIVPVNLDSRQLSFPNGLELSANGSALLISDLNNRRIIMHHLRGPLEGQTKLLMWVPGYSDNIKRGLDTADGQPTYWYACGCAISDGKFEFAEFFNTRPYWKKLLVHWLFFAGSLTDSLARLLGSTPMRDIGLELRAIWLKHDPYCSHGLVVQFNERGQVLRSLQAPNFNSYFKLLSEASEVPIVLEEGGGGEVGGMPNGGSNKSAPKQRRSHLYLGSVYYSYLGRLELEPLEAEWPLGAPASGPWASLGDNGGQQAD